MKFFHWVTDEKFIDDLIYVMEYTKGYHNHTYAILSDTGETDFTYIKRKGDIMIVRPSEFVKTLNDYDVVMLHGLRAGVFDYLNKMPIHIKVVWLAWGYDLYSTPNSWHPFIKIPLYRGDTKRSIRKNMRDWWNELQREAYYLRVRRTIEKAISRVDYFSGVIPQEYEMMKKNPFFKAKRLDFHYFSLNDEVSEANIKNPSPMGNNILIGNSGDPTNNHLDAFQYLKRIEILDKKIYVPLSYGGTEKYREKVKSVGKELWGERFVPLETFLPYDVYCKIRSSCGNVIMCHERQQAMGNIRQALWSGCKVFLSVTGLTYNFYRDLGISVFNLQEELSAEQVKKNLSAVEIDLNRRQMLDTISRESFLDDIYRMYTILEE